MCKALNTINHHVREFPGKYFAHVCKQSLVSFFFLFPSFTRKGCNHLCFTFEYAALVLFAFGILLLMSGIYEKAKEDDTQREVYFLILSFLCLVPGNERQ